MVEPPFMPAPPWHLVQFKALVKDAKAESCLFAERSPGTYGHLSQLEVFPRCASDAQLATNPSDSMLSKLFERHTWMWHPESGHIRPASQSQILIII